jgi:endonuclease/exonuclease/phosphatase (EEP) superfamily protein YafD
MSSTSPDSASTPAAPTPRDRLLRAVASLAAWAILAATLAGFGGGVSWVLGLFSAFRFQLLLASALVSLLLAAGARWRRWPGRGALALALLSVIVNGVLVAPLWMPVERGPGAGPAITVMTFNLNVGNRRLDELASAAPVAKVIESSGAAIVVVEEITVHRLGILVKALPSYRLACGAGRPSAFGIAMLVRRDAEAGDEAALRIESAREINVTDGFAAAGQVELLGAWRGRPFAVLGVHTISALHAHSDQFRAAMLSGAAAWARRQQQDEREAIVIGDFNATPWCGPFTDLLTTGGLTDSHRGLGVQGTWPSWLPAPLRIPIDQCVHSGGLVTRSRAVGTDGASSDHLPLTVDLRWR